MSKHNERSSRARSIHLPVGRVLAGLGAALVLAGPSSALALSKECPVTFSVNEALTLGSLQFVADYSGTPGGFDFTTDGCTFPAGSSILRVDGTLRSGELGWADTTGFTGPGAFATCTLVNPSDAVSDPTNGQFSIGSISASDAAVPPVDSFPTISVSVGSCTSVSPVCTNGVVESGEVCDDGNAVDGDGCDGNCTVSACGNGVVADTEVCDDGNLTNNDGCDSNCTVTACGNGVIAGSEVCDDSNATDGDGCDSNCKVTACGNGVVTSGETCDDGNLTSADGCDSNCTVTACGNGVLTAGEVCDDGNLDGGDGCDANCEASDCPSTPSVGCKISVVPAKSKITLKNNADNLKDVGGFSWKSGDSTTLMDFHTPTSAGATYSWCLYDSGDLVKGLTVDGGPGDGEWKAAGTTGFSFKSKTNAVSGIKLKSGEAGKAQISVKASGKAGFVSPGLPFAAPTLSQFVIDDGVSPVCFQTTAGSPVKNLSNLYIALGNP